MIMGERLGRGVTIFGGKVMKRGPDEAITNRGEKGLKAGKKEKGRRFKPNREVGKNVG